MECLNCPNNDLKIQNSLIKLAEFNINKVGEDLKNKVIKAKVIYEALVGHLEDDATLYLRFRSDDLLRMTLTLAKV